MPNHARFTRRVALASVALPWAIGSGAAHAILPAQPMSERELREVLQHYERSRREIAGLTDRAAIASAIARRDRAVDLIPSFSRSGGQFSNWPATGRIVKSIESGRRLGLAVELAESIGLQTYLGDGLDMTWTSISIDSPIADIVRASRDRSLRVFGGLKVRSEAGMLTPIDMLADSDKAGKQVSLLATFKQIRITAS